MYQFFNGMKSFIILFLIHSFTWRTNHIYGPENEPSLMHIGEGSKIDYGLYDTEEEKNEDEDT